MDIKEKILKIARSEFTKYGFRNVRTDELSQKIGISKRTLYENFQSKEQLFEEVIEMELAKLKESIDIILDRIENNPEVNLIDEIRNMWKIDVDSSIGLTKEFFSDIQKFTPQLWDKIASFRQRVMELNFVKIFKIGQKQGLFRDDINVDLLFLMHITTVQNIMNPEVLLRLNYSPQEVINTIFMVMFSGVLTESARSSYQNHFENICITNKLNNL